MDNASDDAQTNYPERHRSIEMTLVAMMGEHRSWEDIRKIGAALYNVRKQVECMQDERAHLNITRPNMDGATVAESANAFPFT